MQWELLFCSEARHLGQADGDDLDSSWNSQGKLRSPPEDKSLINQIHVIGGRDWTEQRR